MAHYYRYKNLGDSNEFLSYTSDLSIVARCIYAENTNVGSLYRKRSIRATTDVIMNRAKIGMGGSFYSAVVLHPGAFSAMRDGNVGTSNPVFYDSDLDAWSYSLFIANHMYSSIEPWTSGKELQSNYHHFYDISEKMPFYIYSNGTYYKCTSSNVTSATHYRPSSTYYPIIASPIKIDNIIFFSY